MKKENAFQADLIKDIKKQFPGCVVLKNDPDYIQGIPDLTILYKDKWAVLECKRELNASHQNNQDYYVKKLNQMGYASFVYPENKGDVLHELQRSFETARMSRSSVSEQA